MPFFIEESHFPQLLQNWLIILIMVKQCRTLMLLVSRMCREVFGQHLLCQPKANKEANKGPGCPTTTTKFTMTSLELSLICFVFHPLRPMCENRMGFPPPPLPVCLSLDTTLKDLCFSNHKFYYRYNKETAVILEDHQSSLLKSNAWINPLLLRLRRLGRNKVSYEVHLSFPTSPLLRSHTSLVFKYLKNASVWEEIKCAVGYASIS